MTRFISSITTVIFDLDETLICTSPRFLDLFYRVLQGCGLIITESDLRLIERHYAYFWANPHCSRTSLARLSSEEKRLFWSRFIREHARFLRLDENTIDHLTATFIAELAFHNPVEYFAKGAATTLNQLRSFGFDIGLITNRSTGVEQLLEQMRIREFFRSVVTPNDAGVSKPNPGIFHFAIEKMFKTRHEVCYVGDNYYTDVVGAKQAGILPVLLDPLCLFSSECEYFIREIDEIPHFLGASQIGEQK